MSKKFTKIWEREYSLHRMSQVMENFFVDYAKEVLGFWTTKIVSLKMPDGNDAFFVEEGQRLRLVNRMRQIFLNKKLFDDFLKKYKKDKKAFINVSKKVSQQALKTKDPKKLAELFETFEEAHVRNALTNQWFGFYLSEIADQTMTEFIVSKTKNLEQQRTFLSIVLSPDEMSSVRKERVHLLKIALEKNPQKRQRMLAQHVRLFEWVPVINVFKSQLWDQKFFDRELGRLRNRKKIKEELKKINSSFLQTKKAFRKLRLKYSTKECELIDRSHTMAFIKDDRDDGRRKAYFLARPLYAQTAKYLRISTDELLNYTYQEIPLALLQQKILKKSELLAREKGYALLVKNRNIVIKTGKNYRALLKEINKLSKTQKEIKGIAACSGFVRGRARIVTNIETLKKVKKGDILVAVVTHPDYVPTMRLVKAIVTEEGGLTSHAAIVSRELKVPCIVGTKIATKVLKDGDLVEVDANKGIVRKVK